MNINLSQFKRAVKNGSGPKSTYIRYREGSAGYKLVTSLRHQGIDVEKVVEYLLNKAVNGE